MYDYHLQEIARGLVETALATDQEQVELGAVERAGYEFALEVQVQRELVIAKLLEAKEALGSTSAI